jgi:ferric hydroxamate transport system permease protein
VGLAGLALAAVALVGRWPQALPWGLVGVGAAYTVYLALRPGTVDPRAPIVAAILFGAAELGFWSLEPHAARNERVVIARRLALIVGTALGAALLASVVLVVASSASGGVLLEAIGMVAAVATLAVVALLAWRSGNSTST